MYNNLCFRSSNNSTTPRKGRPSGEYQKREYNRNDRNDRNDRHDRNSRDSNRPPTREFDREKEREKEREKHKATTNDNKILSSSGWNDSVDNSGWQQSVGKY